MEQQFTTYKRFDDIVLADDLAEQLTKHDIEYVIEEQSSGFDPSMVMSNSVKEYAVKIMSTDFERVNELLKEDETADVEEIGDDYYLFAFTDEELTDVITKADEWNAFDVVLARKLLAQRGKVLSDEAIADINDKRIEDLKAPEPSQGFWIVLGYMAACLGGVIGIFIGWHLYTFKKTLPNGEKVLGYNEDDRKQGKRIFYFSILVSVLVLAYKLTAVFSQDN